MKILRTRRNDNARILSLKMKFSGKQPCERLFHKVVVLGQKLSERNFLTFGTGGNKADLTSPMWHNVPQQ